MQSALLIISIVCPITVLVVLFIACRKPAVSAPSAPAWTRDEYVVMLRRYRALKQDFKALGYVIAQRSGSCPDVLLNIMRTVRLRQLQETDYLDQLLNLYNRVLFEAQRVSYFDPKVDGQLERLKAALLKHEKALCSNSAFRLRHSLKKLADLSYWRR